MSQRDGAALQTAAPKPGHALPGPVQVPATLLPVKHNHDETPDFASLVLKEICDSELPPFPPPRKWLDPVLSRVPERRGGEAELRANLEHPQWTAV